MDGAGRRRPRLPAHRRRGAGGPPPDLARRRPRGVDVDAGAGAGGVRHGGRGRRRAAAHLVGRPHHQADRLDARGRGAGGERGGAAVAAPPLGARHPGDRRHPAAAAAGPAGRSRAARRRPGRAALGHHDPRDGVAEALPRRHRGQAVVEPRGRVRAPRRRPRRQPRRADAGRRPHRLPLRPRGLGQPLLPRRPGSRPAPPHRPRRRRRARVLRPARRHRRHPRRLRVGRAALAARRPRRRTPAPRRPARRPPHRPRALPHHARASGWAACARTPPAGPASSASAAPCTGSPTATAPPARCRPPPACGPGSPRRWARTARCGSTTRSARTPCASPRSTRAPPTRRETQRFGEFGRVLELVPAPDGKSVALTTHDGRLLLLADGEFRELARGGDGEIYDVAFSPDSAWLAYCDPVGSGLSQVVLVRLEDGEAVPVTEGRFRDADPVFTARRQAPRVPLAAQLRPDLRRARLRPHVPRLLAAVPRAARRAHAVAVRGEPGRAPGLARGRQAGGPTRARRVRPRRRDRGSAQREEDEEGRRPARGGRRHRGARRPRGADPGRRGPLPRHDARPRTACSGTASRSTARSATAARAPT